MPIFCYYIIMANESKETLHFNMHAAIIVSDQNSPEIYPLHWHDAAEFTIALQDGCKYRINDTVFDLEKDDVLLVWPQQIHGTVKIPKKSSLLVQFPATIIESNLDLVSVSRFLFEFHHISAKVYPELARFIREKIDEIQSIYVSS